MSAYLRNDCNFSVDGGIPEKMDGTPHHARCDVYCPFFGVNHRKIIPVIPYHLILNSLKLRQSTSAIDIANGFAIDVANDILPV